MLVGIRKGDQLFGVSHREGAQEHGVEHAEDRSVGTDAQRQRQYREEREPRTLRQHANRVAQVLPKVVHAFHLGTLSRANLRKPESGQRYAGSVDIKALSCTRPSVVSLTPVTSGIFLYLNRTPGCEASSWIRWRTR